MDHRKSLEDFQRNTAFVVLVIVGGLALFVYLAGTLVDVLVPLIWAAFFAVPLTEMIAKVDRAMTNLSASLRWCCQDGAKIKEIKFTAKTGNKFIFIKDESKDDAKHMLEKLVHPCDQMCLISQSRCCQARIRLLEVVEEGVDPEEVDPVNRLVQDWRYYVKDPKTTNKMELELFLDQDCKIPAVIPFEEGGGKEITGSMELDRSSVFSWFCSVVVCMAVLCCAVYIFLVATAMGIDALTRNTPTYGRGLVEFMKWGDVHLRTWLPPETMQGLNNRTRTLAKEGLPEMAAGLATDLEGIAVQLLLFMIYVIFWVFEPIPANSNVAQLIKDYLLLKTLVCLLFAVLMSGLLYFLDCPLWHIFFVVAFLFNYIPEFGFMIVFALAVPAVILDANLTMEKRETNTLYLIAIAILIKVITGNVIETQLYTKWGGQFMHMHPVILMVLIIFFEKLLGFTGMFLAIPMSAMVKYYVHTAAIPGPYRYPTLTMLEGDEVAPHKHFVQDQIRKGLYGSTEDSTETAKETAGP